MDVRECKVYVKTSDRGNSGLKECRVLVMGYMNYGRYLWNPAEVVVDLLDGMNIKGCRVIGKKLPVVLKEVKELVPKYLNSVDPEVSIGVGLNPNISKVVVELASSNLVSFEKPDEKGYQTLLEYVRGNELRVLKTLLPVEKIHRRCVLERNLPLRFTIGIGSYLCNVLGYLISEWAYENGRVGGFLHVPPHTDLAMKLNLRNFIRINDIVDSVKCVIESSIDQYLEKI